MLDIPIYKAEAEIDGLADKIKANRSISYVSQLKPASQSQRKAIIAIATADTPSNIQDLYPTESILASTVCNLNDDVFPKWDTFQARSTPINKPDNLEHDEEQIVGHMVRSWLIDKNDNPIDETSIATVEDLPDLFHVCNASVIYTHWTKNELKERVATLIEEIEAGKKYVSMECLFTTFDYAMIDEKGKLEVISRNATTAFLTKHLRAYGGSGVYDDKRVCRYLRNFVFSGKGYVDAPANPDSIIFSKGRVKVVDFSSATHKNSLNSNAGVYLNNEQLVAANPENEQQEINNMSSELELLKSQLSEAKDALKEATDANKNLEKKIAEADTAQYEAKIQKLESEVEAAKKAQAEAGEQVETLTKEVDTLKAEVTKLTETNASLTQEIAEAEEQKVRANRIATLVDGGIDKTDAEAKVDVFANLNDEQFTTLATELIKAAKKDSEKTPEESTSSTEETSEEETDENEDVASQANLDSAETNDEETVGSAPAETEEDELKETRSALAAYISQRLGKTVASEEDETEEE